MSVIKKTLTLEPSRSRLPGLLPFIGQVDGIPADGNYGQIVCDINFELIPEGNKYRALSHWGRMPYATIISNYRWFRKFFNNCKYYICINPHNTRKVWSPIKSSEQVDFYHPVAREDIKYEMSYWQRDLVDVYQTQFIKEMPEASNYNDGTIIGIPDTTITTEFTFDEFTRRDGLLFYEFIEEAFGKYTIPDRVIGDLVPSFIYIMDAQDFKRDMLKLKTGTCCNLRKYENMGGDTMIQELERFTDEYIIERLSFFKSLLCYNEYTGQPDANAFIPIFLEQDIDDMGIMSLIASEWLAGKLYQYGEIVFHNGHTYCCSEDVTYDNAYVFDNQEWILVDASFTNENGELNTDAKYIPDGLSGNPDFTYIGESQLASLSMNRVAFDDDNNQLPFFPQKDPQGQWQYLDLYREGVIFNRYTYPDGLTYGDMILDINVDESAQTITYTYVINGEMEGNDTEGWEYKYNQTGIRFEETYAYRDETISFYYSETNEDPELHSDIPYRHVYYENNAVDIDSKTKGVILSKITCTSNDLWGLDDEGNSYQTYSPLIKEEILFGISEPLRWKNDMEIDRGSSAAFERHLKLMEVNSMQDLEEYQNNYFNLENS